MIVQEFRDAESAMCGGLDLLLRKGAARSSRNGDVIVVAEPVTTVIAEPWRRVVLSAARDANPFFHLAESLWMLAGRDDVGLPAMYVARMRDYSDDGQRLSGAYGHRWRVRFGVDQPTMIAEALRKNPDDRRQVMQMWGAEYDLCSQGSKRDLPCNLTATFQVDVEGRLNLVVFQRSGDALWGVHGANTVQFSVLLEYVAGLAGYAMGTMTQVTVNYHLYADHREQAEAIVAEGCKSEEQRHEPLGITAKNARHWDKECAVLCGGGSLLTHRFLASVAAPMRDAHRVHKVRNDALALSILTGIPPCDWRTAAVEWLKRRMA